MLKARSLMTKRSMKGLCLSALFCALSGPAFAQAGSDEAAQRLDGDEILRELNDAELHGCYPDGSPWAERTTADGDLYDLLADEAHVGTWWLVDDIVCYSYFANPAVANPSCFAVQRRGVHLDFVLPGTGQLGGTTDCGVDIVDGDGPERARLAR